MLDTATVLPAGPGEPIDNVFPLQDRVRLRNNFGFVLQELRKRAEAFSSLAKGPWSVFIAIAAHFQLNAEAWPGQEAIAQFSGCTTRSVRFHVGALERGGLLVLRRERRADGGERIFYSPGPVMLRELAAFSVNYPRDRRKLLKPMLAAPPVAAPTSDHRPEAPSPPLMERLSMEPNQDQEPSFSCEAAPSTEPRRSPPAEEEIVIAAEDFEVARKALVARLARKHPERPAPRWFDARDLTLVARCSSALVDDRDAKAIAMNDAIAGAFIASKHGPPTVKFIWEKFDHFLDHIERGRRRRLMEERAAGDAKKPPSQDRRAAGAPMSSEVALKLAQLLGAGWRRCHPPAMVGKPARA